MAVWTVLVKRISGFHGGQRDRWDRSHDQVSVDDD